MEFADYVGGKRRRRRHNKKGAGFLSDAFGTIANITGTVGKFVPQLKPFQALLGDNSAYGLAAKGLKSIGLGRKNRKMRGCGNCGCDTCVAEFDSAKDAVHHFVGSGKIHPDELLEIHQHYIKPMRQSMRTANMVNYHGMGHYDNYEELDREMEDREMEPEEEEEIVKRVHYADDMKKGSREAKDRMAWVRAHRKLKC